MPYTHTTFAEAKQSLAQDLGDPTKTFWTDAELGRYIIEALRWWGLEAMYFRETARLTTAIGQAFYDVTSGLEDLGGNLLQEMTVDDNEILNDVRWSLMEPQLPAAPSEMFNASEMTSVLMEARDELQKLGAPFMADVAVPTVLGQSRVELPENIIRVHRVSVNEVGSQGPLPIWAVDQIQLQSTTRSTIIPASGRPKAFAVSYSPQLTLDLWPPPANPTTLRMQVTQSGLPFAVPDDASLLLKYKVMEDLLSGDGLARAPMMAEYCSRRYDDGLQALARYQSLLWANIDGRHCPLTSVAQLDQVRPTWQQTAGGVRSVAQLNWNLFAITPVPNAEQVINFEIVRKAPLPVADGDFIQVGHESMRAIYEYAHHVACFKMQGQEFMNTMSYYEEAMGLAEDYRQQVASQSYLYRETQLPANQDKWSRPMRRKLAVEAAVELAQAVEQ